MNFPTGLFSIQSRVPFTVAGPDPRQGEDGHPLAKKYFRRWRCDFCVRNSPILNGGLQRVMAGADLSTQH